MDEKLTIVQLGALLHDIGKIIRRAGLSNLNHSQAGIEYLKEHLLLPEKYNEVLDIINFHHAKELKEANLPSNSLAYIVYEADNIASGIDRVKYEDKMQLLGNEMMPLNSIFNRLKSEKNNIEKFFPLINMKENKFNMPIKKRENEKLESTDYLKILNNLKENMKVMKDNFHPEKLTTILEESCIYFPSSAYVDYPDISYYDHVKITAAIASCMYLYDKENSILDYKKEYFSENDSRKKDKYLFVSGEFSGIQNFIYTITSKMAMKSLRGRSFYLELFIEHIIDEILSTLELSRVNLIYSGGSQFYLLLPNIKESREILEKYKEIINNFLLKETGTKIYYESSYIVTNAEELGNGLSKEKRDENKIGKIFKKIGVLSSKSKLNRYSNVQLGELFDENSELNKIHSYTKECNICKKAEKEEILTKNFNNNQIEICDSCKNYINLGKEISKLYHSNNDIFILEEEYENIKNSDSLLLPKYPNGYITIKTIDKNKILARLKQKDNTIHRYYAINSYYFGDKLCKNIWIGNYNVKGNKDSEDSKNSLIEFKELVEMSKGIRKLGVLRADIDNLGLLFQSGFVNENSNEPYKFVTLSKSVVLSRYLSDFFKNKVNLILEKKNAIKKTNEIFTDYCNIINENEMNKNYERKIVVVYSGGDDLFAIGTWDDIIEFSVDLRQAFKEFTNEKITLSAGIGLFSENFPVYQMAQKTGNLEKIAKSYYKSKEKNLGIPTKDAIALFGEINDELNHVYSWDDFIEKVLYEKYKYIKTKTTFEENNTSEKIFVGKSKWYKLMELIRDLITEDVKNYKLDVARFAYILARIKNNDKNRLNYQEFKEKIFKWIKNKEDAKQLLTAINILIYEERGK